MTHHESQLQTLPWSRFLKDKPQMSYSRGWVCIFKAADEGSGAGLVSLPNSLDICCNPV